MAEEQPDCVCEHRLSYISAGARRHATDIDGLRIEHSAGENESWRPNLYTPPPSDSRSTSRMIVFNSSLEKFFISPSM